MLELHRHRPQAAVSARRPRRQWLGAESLEPRAMLSTVPFLADSALQTATVFTAQGRYGNNAINGDWELGITTNTNKPPQKQTGHVWNGSLDSATGVTTVREQFTFDVLNTTAASFGVGGSNISFDYAGRLTGNQPNAIKIWAKASTANSGLTLANLKLTTPGMSVPKEFPEASIAVSQSSGPDFQQRLIAGVDFSSGSGQPVTLTGDVGMSFAQTSPRGSSLQFHVMAVYLPVPIVTVDVAPGQVTEDGPQNLTYTFTATGPLTRDVTVKYEVGGTATEGGDFTGAPSGAGVRSITIPATASPTSSATLTITPTPDTVIEDDETVVIALQNGSGYTFDPNHSFATGTIENDDYLVDLVLDGLPEETAPEPNELSPGAILPIGGGRTRLDLIVESPGYAGTVTLLVTADADGADVVTLWDSKKDGTQVLPTTWQVGQHPRTLWVEATGQKAAVQFVAMFQSQKKRVTDTANADAPGLTLNLRSRALLFDSANAADTDTMDGVAALLGLKRDDIIKAPIVLVDPATGKKLGQLRTTRRWKAELMKYEVAGGQAGWPVSEKLSLQKVKVTGLVLGGKVPPAEVLELVEASFKAELEANYSSVEKVAGELGGAWYPKGSITATNQFTDILALAVPPEITDFEVIFVQDLFVKPPSTDKVKVATIEYRWMSAADDPGNFTLTRKVLP